MKWLKNSVLYVVLIMAGKLNLALDTGQHGFIVGKTGSGKSVLAHTLIPPTGTVLVVDPKRMFDLPNAQVIDKPSAYTKHMLRVVYRPSVENLNDHAAYNEIYKKAFIFGIKLVYTDEVVPLLRGLKAPHYYYVCYQLGRSKGISMLSATQRPACIPRVLMSEATKLYAFNLQDADDIVRMKKMLPGYRARPTDSHSFTFFDSEESETGTLVKLQL